MSKIYKNLIRISLAIGSCFSFCLTSSALPNNFNDAKAINISDKCDEEKEDAEETMNAIPTMNFLEKVGTDVAGKVMDEAQNKLKEKKKTLTKKTKKK